MNTVFIVDDHPVIRLAIRMLLEHEGYEIVGETDNGVDAMQMIRQNNPGMNLKRKIPPHHSYRFAQLGDQRLGQFGQRCATGPRQEPRRYRRTT